MGSPAATPASGEGFGTRLRRLRESAGLTQEELAERAGLTAHGISALERGTRTRPYPHTVRALARGLDLDPAEHDALVAAARAVRAGGRQDRPAEEGASPSGVRGLPAEVTPLVGRDDDVAAVTSLLRRTTSRLVTLTGTGGVGKTRLAHAVAEVVAAEHRDGAAVVGFAGVADGDDVLAALARGLGVPTSGGDEAGAEARVLGHLREARLLLVLDNLEHLRGAGASVAQVLSACPGVRVLATSRAALRVRGESEYAVQPLPTPPESPAGPEEVLASPAAALLLERARAVAPGFGGHPGDHLAIAALCRRLAGIPLALEIAAARARLLDARSLLARLDDAMSRPGPTDLPARQRTMRATLEWSYRLLGEEERTLLRRLGVFSGGFDVDAVDAVGGDLTDPWGLLERLAEHSLVTVAAGPDGPRVTMLEPVAQYARELLTDDEAAHARTAHAVRYLTLAETAAPRYLGAEQVTWLTRLAHDDANLVAAVEWWIARGDGERAGRMVWALWLYWWLRGDAPRGRRLAEAAAGLEASDGVRVRSLLTAAAMAFAQGDLGASGPLWARAGSLAVAADDGEGRLYGAAGDGLVALGAGRTGEAERSFQAALELAVVAPDEWVVSLARVWLGTVRLLSGDVAGAVAQTGLGLESARARGDRLTTYVALYGLVQAALADGDHATARAHLHEGLRLSVETGDEANLAYFLESLAVVESARGRHTSTATLLGAAAALRDRLVAPVYGYYLPDPTLRDRAEQDARRALGEVAYRDAVGRGRRLDGASAVRLALADDDGTGDGMAVAPG